MRHRAGTMEAPSAEMFVSLDDLHNIEDIEVSKIFIIVCDNSSMFLPTS